MAPPFSRSTEDPSIARDLSEAAATLARLAREACRPRVDTPLVDQTRAAAAAVAAGITRLGGPVAAGRATGGLAQTLRDSLPRLRDLILKDLPAPGERETVACPGALATRFALFRILGGCPLIPPRERREIEGSLREAITHAAVFYQHQMSGEVGSSDPIDIRAVAFDHLRIDILIWLLEEMEAEQEILTVRAQAHIVARAAIRRARMAIETFIAHRGPAQRFDVAVIVAEVEELGALIERILEVGAHEDSPLWRGNRDTVNAFTQSCGKLVLATFRETEDRLHDGRLTVGALGGALKQIEAIHGLLIRINADHSGMILKAVERAITRKANTLLVRLSSTLAPDVARPMIGALGDTLDRISRRRSPGPAPESQTHSGPTENR